MKQDKKNFGRLVTEETLPQLSDRFINLWQRHTLVDSHEATLKVFNQLVEMYTTSWRSYHNISHIQSCLNYFDACQAQAEFPDSVELAIWFHDCVYEVNAADNEARSRDWFVEQSEGFLVARLVATVSELIMDTVHNDVPDNRDGKLLSDIDLTSFGLPWDEYMLDSDEVDDESARFNDADPKTAKPAFLMTLMNRKPLYYSAYYLQHFEQMAQQNIRKHLALFK